MVLDLQDQVVGIVSERDVVRMIAEKGERSLAQPVQACMTRDVEFADPTETVGRPDGPHDRPPVPAPAGLHPWPSRGGSSSIGDLVKAKIAEVETEAEHLKAYIAAG